MYSAVIVRWPILQITNIVPSGPGASAAGFRRRVHGVCADQRRPADASGVLPRHTQQAIAACLAKLAVADPLHDIRIFASMSQTLHVIRRTYG